MFDHYYKEVTYSRPEFLYFWGYYFFMNFIWMVFPGSEYFFPLGFPGAKMGNWGKKEVSILEQERIYANYLDSSAGEQRTHNCEGIQQTRQTGGADSIEPQGEEQRLREEITMKEPQFPINLGNPKDDERSGRIWGRSRDFDHLHTLHTQRGTRNEQMVYIPFPICDRWVHAQRARHGQHNSIRPRERKTLA